MAGRAGEDRLKFYKRHEPVKQDARRKQIAAERKQQRDNRRTEAFTARRGLVHTEPVVSTRQQKLEEWKKRRPVSRKEVEKAKKPAFIVGKIAYNDTHLYKPSESAIFQPPKGLVPVKTPQPVRTLRSNARNQQKGPVPTVKEAIGAFASAMALQNASKIPSKHTPGKTGNVSDLLNRTFEGTQTNSVKCERETFQFNLGSYAKVEIVPTEVLERPLHNSSPVIETRCPEISGSNTKNHEPVRRRKSNRNTAVQKDCMQSVLCVEEPKTTKDMLKQTSEEKSAVYFRSLYNAAVAKLNSLCTEWTDQIQGLPDVICEDINVAIGYAQLLISQKLQQFLDLIVEHENTNSSTELKVFTSDLDGFWSMVNNQVEDIYRKFEKLETLKQNNWQHLNGNSMSVKQITQNNAPKPKMIKSKGNATSGLRSFLAQARRQARMGADENSYPAIASSIEMPRPMSPVVMRVASKVKTLGSPKIQTPLLIKARSPLSIVQPDAIVQTPKSTRKTPAHKRAFLKTPGSTPMRRSTRLQAKVNEELN